MGKGILLELEGRTGIVLTPEGEFRRVPLPAGDPAVGDEILVPRPAPNPGGGPGAGWRRPPRCS